MVEPAATQDDSSSSGSSSDEELEDGELEDSGEVATLKHENAQLKKQLNSLLNGPISNYGVYCSITYNRLSKESQKLIEEILLKEYAEIDKEREDDTVSERREEEEEDKEEAPPRNQLHYYKGFIVDKMGSHDFLQKTNIMSHAPTYDRFTNEVLGETTEPLAVESSPRTPRAKGACWNCGATDHQLMDCPQPRNRAMIEEKRREHLENTPTQQKLPEVRYYGEDCAVDKSLRDSFKPGALSQSLKDALGMKENDQPPYYRAMRIHGYPPSYIESELEMDDPLAKESKEPTVKGLFPGLGIPPQRTPTHTPSATPSHTPNATPTKTSVPYPTTPSSPPTNNNNRTPHTPNSPVIMPNGLVNGFAIPLTAPPRSHLLPVPFPPPFLNLQTPNNPAYLYAAANANRPSVHQMQHIKHSTSAASDLSEADMDVT